MPHQKRVWRICRVSTWFLFLLPACASAVEPDLTTWSDKIAPALKQAAAENKMVFVEIAPDWDPNSRTMDDFTLSDSSIQKMLSNYIQVKFSPTDDLQARKLANQFGANYIYPLIGILDARGVFAAKHVGYENTTLFRRFLLDFEQRFSFGEAPFEVRWNVLSTKFQTYRFDLPADEVATAPIWPDTESAPPLPSNKAVMLAQTRLAELTPHGWLPQFIRLSRLNEIGPWFYRIVFLREPPPDVVDWLDGGYDSVPVLMSGFIPKPQLIQVWTRDSGQPSPDLKPTYSNHIPMPHNSFDHEHNRTEVQWTQGLFKYKMYRFTLPDHEIANSPVLNFSADAPPLAPRDAINIAQARLNEITLTPAWKFAFLDLMPLDRKGHWVYMPTFRRIDPPDALEWDHEGLDAVPVLMNGYAPEPELFFTSPEASQANMPLKPITPLPLLAPEPPPPPLPPGYHSPLQFKTERAHLE
jgi:Thioredoxin-like